MVCITVVLDAYQKSRMGLPDMESTFETLVEAFVFLDKNHDGHVSRREMVEAINETTSGERSSGRIAMRRFGQFSLFLSTHMYMYFICNHGYHEDD